MFDLDNWQEIWSTITRNKTRSFFTGFGVFWGIFMLVVLIGVGNSLQGGFAKNLDGFASNSCFFHENLTSEAYKGFRKGRRWNMNNRDVVLIQEKAKALEYISPMLFGGGGAKNVVKDNRSGSYGTRGVYPAHFKIEQQTVLDGRLFNDIDTKNYRKVCIIGTEVRATLFKDLDNVIGQYIRVNGIYFQVIGVISPKSSASIGGDVQSTVFLPFTTMQRTFNQGDVIHFLACTAKPGYPAAVLENEVKSILKQAHSISPTDEKAVRSFNIEEQFKIFNMLFTGVDILIWFVGLGALFSGIIGISNIMLVTVKERTREIGVRRALGAKPITIIIQIMSESFLLTTIAGFLGFVFGIAMLELATQILFAEVEEIGIMIAPFVTLGTSMMAMLVLVVAALIAGLMPALRALQVKAIDAIRDE